jgi:hypothetical protein
MNGIIAVPQIKSIRLLKSDTALTPIGRSSFATNDLKKNRLGFRAYNKMRNGRVARDLPVAQGARRENIL